MRTRDRDAHDCERPRILLMAFGMLMWMCIRHPSRLRDAWRETDSA